MIFHPVNPGLFSVNVFCMVIRTDVMTSPDYLFVITD
jgi:hypothetical protein